MAAALPSRGTAPPRRLWDPTFLSRDMGRSPGRVVAIPHSDLKLDTLFLLTVWLADMNDRHDDGSHL
eukprot:6078294-Pyramimonas_sp.AAC.1